MVYKFKNNIKAIKITITLILLIALTYIVLSVILPSIQSNIKIGNPKTISELSYEINKNNFEVYIKENGKYIPFLVLTNNYNGEKGHTLLLRKYLLNEPILYSHNYNTNQGGGLGHTLSAEENKKYLSLINKGYKINGSNEGSYYKESYINYYLNNEYIMFLDILPFNVDIKITKYPPRVDGLMQYDIEEMSTQIFLLSFSEIFEYNTSIIEKEGKQLKYFKDNGIDTNNLLYSPIFTRSMYHSQSLGEQVVSYTNEGSYGGGTGFNKLYIRPAFVIDSNTKIIKNEEGKFIIIKS